MRPASARLPVPGRSSPGRRHWRRCTGSRSWSGRRRYPARPRGRRRCARRLRGRAALASGIPVGSEAALLDDVVRPVEAAPGDRRAFPRTDRDLRFRRVATRGREGPGARLRSAAGGDAALLDDEVGPVESLPDDGHRAVGARPRAAARPRPGPGPRDRSVRGVRGPARGDPALLDDRVGAVEADPGHRRGSVGADDPPRLDRVLAAGGEVVGSCPRACRPGRSGSPGRSSWCRRSGSRRRWRCRRARPRPAVRPRPVRFGEGVAAWLGLERAVWVDPPLLDQEVEAVERFQTTVAVPSGATATCGSAASCPWRRGPWSVRACRRGRSGAPGPRICAVGRIQTTVAVPSGATATCGERASCGGCRELIDGAPAVPSAAIRRSKML